MGDLVITSTHVDSVRHTVRVETSGPFLLLLLVLAIAAAAALCILAGCLRKPTQPKYQEIILPSGGRVSIPAI
jgi:hypothetical protein